MTISQVKIDLIVTSYFSMIIAKALGNISDTFNQRPTEVFEYLDIGIILKNEL